jgi:hypothetical protein
MNNFNVDNSKIILELFNFKKGLTLEQDELDQHVSLHISLLNSNDIKKPSQKAIVRSLNERLSQFTYDKSVVSLLENLNQAVQSDELFYDLDELYRNIESQNQGMIYRQLLQTILDILNCEDEKDRCVKIINELSLYDWIPVVKQFIFNFSTNPNDRKNISSAGGKGELVYSVVQKVEDGFIAFVGDKWFSIKEDAIEPVTPSDYIKDQVVLAKLNNLAEALRIGYIENNIIEFTVDGDMTLGISLDNNDVFLNGEKVEMSVDEFFASALVPMLNRTLYPVISEVVKSKDMFTILDIVMKVTNISKPFLATYVFNYGSTVYAYIIDTRSNSSFVEYASVTALVNEVNSTLGFDLSEFLKDRFEGETKVLKDLESKEKLVATKLSDINENIEKLEECGLISINEQIKLAYSALIAEKEEIISIQDTIKSKISALKYR